ncbi:tetratricopeptide repeat protein [Arachidicoccus sp.]|uniref:tetratricopeptide repeat protein n=1 Tax=Arachidicoccus sp. TaxID=1872624 RepID=UPI003D2492DC
MNSDNIYFQTKKIIKNFLSASVFFLSFLGVVFGHNIANYHYDFNKRCDKAYESIMSLQMNEGRRLIAIEEQQNPTNLIPVFLANYADFLTLIFNGSPQEYATWKPLMEDRMNRLDRGDKSSPWYGYCKATMNFQGAFIHLRFNEFVSGGFQFRKSFLQLKNNQSKFPQFKYNQILLGLEEAIIGSAPDSYKWITNLLGMRGSIRGGVSKLVNFLNHSDDNDTHLKIETILYYCYLKFYLLEDREQTWNYINDSKLDTKNNLLFAYMKANLALDDNKASLAEQTLQARNQSSAYLDVPLFNCQLGIALLDKMDENTVIYLKRFINEYKGSVFLKNAYQKLSYYYLIKGEIKNALFYKQKILQTGSLEVDADKYAQRYAKSPNFPNVLLLKAKLYCDGGYYTKALDELATQKPAELGSLAEKLEYYYRYGHICNLTGKKEAAISCYNETIKLGQESQEQFAARSALELAQLYENLGQKSKAIQDYSLCLSMKDHDFQSSIDQKAKSGMNRLGR